jgi:hypothetical protein
MPSQICGFNKDGEMKWFDGGKLPSGWSVEAPTQKEGVPGDVQPGEGDGTLKGSDPDCCDTKENPKPKAKAKKKGSREPEAAE